MTEQNITNGNGNGIRRGFEQVITYLIGAGIVGIIIALWNLTSAVASLSASNITTSQKVDTMSVTITQLGANVGELKGRFDQYSNDQRHEVGQKP